MVPPAGLAGTVMPPSAAPAADLMVPLKTRSAAFAGEAAASARSVRPVMLLNAVLPNVRPFAFRMAFLRWSELLLWRCRRRRHRLEIGNDRIDLRGRVG